MIKGRLELFDCVKKGWVMDGFPKTREQAQALQAAGIYPKHFVLLDAPDTVLIERATGKRIDPKTGGMHSNINPYNAELLNYLQSRRFLKTVQTLSSWYSLESSCWVLSYEYPCARVSIIFQVFCIILCYNSTTLRKDSKEGIEYALSIHSESTSWQM